jgi:hypothetical protein
MANNEIHCESCNDIVGYGSPNTGMTDLTDCQCHNQSEPEEEKNPFITVFDLAKFRGGEGN